MGQYKLGIQGKMTHKNQCDASHLLMLPPPSPVDILIRAEDYRVADQCRRDVVQVPARGNYGLPEALGLAYVHLKNVARLQRIFSSIAWDDQANGHC